MPLHSQDKEVLSLTELLVFFNCLLLSELKSLGLGRGEIFVVVSHGVNVWYELSGLCSAPLEGVCLRPTDGQRVATREAGPLERWEGDRSREQ